MANVNTIWYGIKTIVHYFVSAALPAELWGEKNLNHYYQLKQYKKVVRKSQTSQKKDFFCAA